jgi:hypothetical protein
VFEIRCPDYPPKPWPRHMESCRRWQLTIENIMRHVMRLPHVFTSILHPSHRGIMSLPNQGRDIVTTLPNELLGRIIDLCRPDDFETSILTCRRIYQAARHLISEHNHCKNFSQDLNLELSPSVHITIRTPFDFLEQILTRPSKCNSTSFVTSRN